MIKYHWTGEYREPERNEWFILAFDHEPQQKTFDFAIGKSWILRREELPDPGGA